MVVKQIIIFWILHYRFFRMSLPETLAGLGENQYFGAGFGLLAIGFAATTLKKGIVFGSQFMRRYLVTTLEIPVSDHSYNWILSWIAQRPDMSCHLSVHTAFQKLHSGKIATGFEFSPSPGSHLLWYRRLPIKVDRVREKQMIGDQSLRVPYETVTLTTLGRNKKLFEQILSEARENALQMHQNMTLIFKPVGVEWKQFGNPQRRRPLSSVNLMEGQSGRIVNDVSQFLSSQKWYVDRGIPYRRGYLLYGPPGCGKTSFITALAGELEFSISIMNVGDLSLSDDRLLHFMVSAPPQSIILLEDIDAAFIDRASVLQKDPRYQGMNTVSFSGLLNALDGVVSSDGRLVFMTTNHIDKLDPALLRPGRIDVKEYIGYANSFQTCQAFRHFFPHESDEAAEEFSTNVANFVDEVSMAQIQAYFMLYRFDANAAISNVNKMQHL